MQSDPFTNFLTFLFLNWLQILSLGILWITLVIVYWLLRNVLRRGVRKSGAQPTVLRGLMVALALIFVYIALNGLFIFLPDIYGQFSVILGTSALIIGAAVGIAIGQAAQNFVSGLYVLFTQPFRIGDLVRVGAVEGIVQEISTNYTKILEMTSGNSVKIPNVTVLNSQVISFRLTKEDLDEVQAELEAGGAELFQKVKSALEEKSLVRFTLNLNLSPRNRDPRPLRLAFDEVCRQWTNTFGFQPLHLIGESQSQGGALLYQFSIYAKEPRTIFKYRSNFMDDILDAAAQTQEDLGKQTDKKRGSK
ncbi:MAG: mechanosensitive ion channel domain-containing protein [Promethearchaeota archaeon]